VRALVIEGQGAEARSAKAAIALDDVPAPVLAGECLIRVRLAGICGTDLQLIEGYAGFQGIPGHEFVGDVEAVDDPRDEKWIGRRVAGEINVGCGTCEFCKRGVKEHCISRSVLGIIGRGGAFAERLSLPSRNLHAIPDSIDDETAVFVEPVAAACRILEQVKIPADASVAVLGDGRLGLVIAQVLRAAAEDVTVIGRHEHKLAIARELGLAAQTAAETNNRRYDIVVEVTGRSTGLSAALALVKPLGTIVLKSTFHGAVQAETWPAIVDEVTLVGSRCGPFARAIALLEAGAVQIKPLIARTADLADYEAAFADARRGLKILLRP
jgi:threonine dehydrogenase-like Zn-dependent dehydrogenase